MKQNIVDIENELDILKQKLFNPSQDFNKEDETLI